MWTSFWLRFRLKAEILEEPEVGMQNGGQASLFQVMSVQVARMNLSESADVPFVVTLLQSPEARQAVGLLQHMLIGELGSHGTSSLGEPFGW